MAVENTQQYHGLYHVLGGLISPMDGIGPADLEIDSLVARVAEGKVNEIIFALSSTMEGDTTNFYISRKLADYPVKLSVIARGISVGDELEYTDEVTLGRSILNRTPSDSNLRVFLSSICYEFETDSKTLMIIFWGYLIVGFLMVFLYELEFFDSYRYSRMPTWCFSCKS